MIIREAVSRRPTAVDFGQKELRQFAETLFIPPLSPPVRPVPPWPFGTSLPLDSSELALPKVHVSDARRRQHDHRRQRQVEHWLKTMRKKSRKRRRPPSELPSMVAPSTFAPSEASEEVDGEAVEAMEPSHVVEFADDEQDETPAPVDPVDPPQVRRGTPKTRKTPQ